MIVCSTNFEGKPMSFDQQFQNWLEASNRFSDDERALPNVQDIFHIKISEDKSVCWVIGYTAIGHKYSVVFDDIDNSTDEELDYSHPNDYRSWNTKVKSHEKLFEDLSTMMAKN